MKTNQQVGWEELPPSEKIDRLARRLIRQEREALAARPKGRHGARTTLEQARTRVMQARPELYADFLAEELPAFEATCRRNGHRAA